MLCPLTRWLISRKADTGKRIPGWAARHAERCEGCRDFAAFAETLPARLSGNVSFYPAAVPGIAARRNPPETTASPADRRAGRRLILRPVPAAAMVLALAGGIFLILGILSRPPLTPDRAKTAFAELNKAAAIPGEWPGVVAAVESPLVRERLLLEKAARSAYAYLQDRLNFTIERKDANAS